MEELDQPTECAAVNFTAILTRIRIRLRLRRQLVGRLMGTTEHLVADRAAHHFVIAAAVFGGCSLLVLSHDRATGVGNRVFRNR